MSMAKWSEQGRTSEQRTRQKETYQTRQMSRRRVRVRKMKWDENESRRGGTLDSEIRKRCRELWEEAARQQEQERAP